MKNNIDKNWINKSIFTVSRKKYNKQKLYPKKTNNMKKQLLFEKLTMTYRNNVIFKVI